MFETTNWFWFLLGFIPYRIEREFIRNGWQLDIKALFWTFTVTRRIHRRKRRRFQRTSWTLRIPFIEKLREAIWTAVISLRK